MANQREMSLPAMEDVRLCDSSLGDQTSILRRFLDNYLTLRDITPGRLQLLARMPDL